MRGDALASTTVVPLDARESGLRETAWWIAERHPDWGEALAGYFGGRLANLPAGGEERALLERRLAQFGATPALQARLARAATDGDARARALVLSAMARARLKVLPQVWAVPLASLLTAGEDRTSQLALAVLRASPPGPADAPVIEAALVGVGRDAPGPSLSASRPWQRRAADCLASSPISSPCCRRRWRRPSRSRSGCRRLRVSGGRGSTRRSCWR